MNALRKHITTGIMAVLGCLSLTAGALAQNTWFPLLTAPGDVQMELIGEVINSAAFRKNEMRLRQLKSFQIASAFFAAVIALRACSRLPD